MDMPKYYVTLEETVHHQVEVDATNAKLARKVAIEQFYKSPDPHHDFCASSQGVEAIDCEKSREPAYT
jgi:hypothetical protein